MRIDLVSRIAFAVTFSILSWPRPALRKRKVTRTREKKFEECASCHSVERGNNGVGPNLAGLFERKAGALDDTAIRPALKRSGLTGMAGRARDFIGSQKLVRAKHAYAGMPTLERGE